MMFALVSPIGMLAPVYYGWVFDKTGNYDIAFKTAVALVVLGIIAMLFVRPPGRSAREATW